MKIGSKIAVIVASVALIVSGGVVVVVAKAGASPELETLKALVTLGVIGDDS